eukprot:CAMPEP_0175131960 /NCGR_PEP_ID=MMETSP0087-20121206/6824_1 /TAXON_ID=136419 /ORGANISM="Unknown Unknown, Strain D1" /LENGTH=342 /DNA_ID=CAMNT_0016414291 /DNA_START=46 /DNA_END=1074 /DNA_ORIENTATION=-
MKEVGKRIVVITGAGISTDSGIPDYRSPGRPPHKPMTHSAFMAHHHNRQRYWTRSMLGYPVLNSAQPNLSHHLLAKGEQDGLISSIITQNVDGLHQQAGSTNVEELHGSIHQVVCMSCGDVTQRADFQHRLAAMNPWLVPFVKTSLLSPPPSPDKTPLLSPPPSPDGPWQRRRRENRLENRTQHSSPSSPSPAPLPPGSSHAESTSDLAIRPDGDAAVQGGQLDYHLTCLPRCLQCGGSVLKPHVVMFGGTLLPEVRERSAVACQEADGLLVIGTSLAVWSAFRLVKLHPGTPVCIVNAGDTRADELCNHPDHNITKIEGRASDVLWAALGEPDAAAQHAHG